MARVETIIVGGGIGSAAPFTVGTFPVVVSVDPPLISDGNIRQDANTPPRVFVGESVGQGTLVTAGATFLGGAIPALNIGPAVVMGNGATATQTAAGGTGNVVVIGRNASYAATAASAGNAVVIGGVVSVVSGGSQVAIGFGASITGGGSTPQVAIGGATISASGGSNILIGRSNSINGTVANSIAIGGNVNSSGSRNIAIGGAVNASFSVVLIGESNGSISFAGSTGEAVLITPGAGGMGGGVAGELVVIGAAPTVSTGQRRNVLLGSRVNDGGNSDTIVLGAYALSIGANSCVIGGGTSGATGISTVLIGRGNTHTAAHPVGVRFTNASGTNIAIGDLTITAPRSTGNATPGALILQVGQQGASGTTLQAAVAGAQVQWSNTAQDTYLLLFDVDNNTLERVSVGAPDSGGAGFKVLRIPN